MGTQPQFPITPKLGVAQITSAMGTTAQTIVTAGTNATKVVGLNLASTDTTARVIQVNVVRSATSYLLTSVTVPITAGNDGVTLPVNALSAANCPGLPTDNDGNPYLLMVSGDTLTINSTTTVTTAKIVSGLSVESDF